MTRLVWRNPHITFYIEAENDQGELVEWGIESGSIPIMSRSGWTEDMLVPGDEVVVRAHPDKGHRTHVMMISFDEFALLITAMLDTTRTVSSGFKAR